MSTKKAKVIRCDGCMTEGPDILYTTNSGLKVMQRRGHFMPGTFVPDGAQLPVSPEVLAVVRAVVRAADKYKAAMKDLGWVDADMGDEERALLAAIAKLDRKTTNRKGSK